MTQENYHIGVLQDLKSAIRTAWGSDAEIEKTEICNALNEAIKALEQEPTTKNDLGIDCIDRAYIYNRIKKIDHDEDYECDEFGGSKITYHTCDWDEVLREIEDAPSVTPQEPRWIPVSERLPKFEYGESDSVLVCFENETQDVLYFNGSNWCYPTGESYISVNHKNDWHNKVVAWMPLPKAYREVEDGNDN